MQLLRDNLTLWTSSEADNEAAPAENKEMTDAPAAAEPEAAKE